MTTPETAEALLAEASARTGGLTDAGDDLTVPLTPFTESLAADNETHTPQCRHETGPPLIGDMQILNGEKRALDHALFGSNTSRRPSPSRLKPKLTVKMARPGMVATHHWSRR